MTKPFQSLPAPRIEFEHQHISSSPVLSLGVTNEDASFQTLKTMQDVNEELAKIGAKLFREEVASTGSNEELLVSLRSVLSQDTSPRIPTRACRKMILDAYGFESNEDLIQQMIYDCGRVPQQHLKQQRRVSRHNLLVDDGQCQFNDDDDDYESNYITMTVAAGPPLIRKINHFVNGLHINCTADEGEAYDEVMTLIKQTKDTHFFYVGPDGICRHLILPPLTTPSFENDPSQNSDNAKSEINGRSNDHRHSKIFFWRLSFSTNIPHYVMMDEGGGIVLHYSIGNRDKKKSWFSRKMLPIKFEDRCRDVDDEGDQDSKERTMSTKSTTGKIQKYEERVTDPQKDRLGERPFGKAFTIDDDSILTSIKETVSLLFAIIHGQLFFQ